ncbi:NYN domain-containing protein [Halomarina ordinaria]|uniref:NYN domain-containing protein n=1 Tax=Halomarina ordinaria TaxID=3033939 RepID=A0ABD5U9K5_9EURY|nr:NYN domain-containing protein [Halomarina sp. PSRA2]
MSGLLRRFVGDEERRVGLFVDGPNVFRTEFDVDLDDVRTAAAERGRITHARLYVDEHATPGLIQAAEAHGFEVVTTSGDVDVKLAVDATTAVVDGDVDVLAVASRDMDFKPVLEVAAARGARTLAIAPGDYGRSDALPSTAHEAVTLD